MNKCSSIHENIDSCLQLTYMQRGVIKLLSQYHRPLRVEEILHELPLRPCGKKFVPQLFALEKKCVVFCDRSADKCMGYKYELTSDGKKLARCLNYL